MNEDDLDGRVKHPEPGLNRLLAGLTAGGHRDRRRGDAGDVGCDHRGVVDQLSRSHHDHLGGLAHSQHGMERPTEQGDSAHRNESFRRRGSQPRSAACRHDDDGDARVAEFGHASERTRSPTRDERPPDEQAHNEHDRSARE